MLGKMLGHKHLDEESPIKRNMHGDNMHVDNMHVAIQMKPIRKIPRQSQTKINTMLANQIQQAINFPSLLIF